MPIVLKSELGFTQYICDFQVSDVLKGDTTVTEKTIKRLAKSANEL